MSNTRRHNNKYRTEILRIAKPYKRQRKNELLSEFELAYIEGNRIPQIIL